MNHLRTIGTAILEKFPNQIFSLEQIERIAKTDRKLTRDIFWTLCEEGLVRMISKKKKPEKEYGQPPSYTFQFRVTSKKALAERIAPRLLENTVPDRIWFIIRKKKSFTARDLVILSGAPKRNTVRWYMKALRHMGVIQPIGKGGPGCEWTLIEDVGPKRPYVGDQAKRIRKKQHVMGC